LVTLNPSDWIAIASLTVSASTLWIAYRTIRQGNKNSSTAILIALNDAFRAAWERYISAEDTKKSHEFAELLNVLEIACAIHHEGSLFGVSKTLSRDYIENIIILIENDDKARMLLETMIHAPNTFEFIALFRKRMRKRPSNVHIIGPKIR